MRLDSYFYWISAFPGYVTGVTVEAGTDASRSSGIFQTTHWSVIERARGPLTDAAAQALNHLCQAYWKPIYIHARAKGLDHHEASDAVQELFAKLMRNEFLDKVGRDRGRFRTFLLACVDHHLASRWAKDHAQKRGAHAEHVELGAARDQSTPSRSPDQEFDYQWMLALVREVLNRLKVECDADGRSALFNALKGLLAHERDTGGSHEAAAALGISEEAIRAALYRLRKRYKEMFREEVARTLANPFDVDDEIRHLLQIFR